VNRKTNKEYWKSKLHKWNNLTLADKFFSVFAWCVITTFLVGVGGFLIAMVVWCNFTQPLIAWVVDVILLFEAMFFYSLVRVLEK